MIKTFADKRTKDLYETGKARRFPTDVAKRAARKLEYVDLAVLLKTFGRRQGIDFIC